MRVIALSNNNLTGELPTTICDHLPNLEGLLLSENILGGVIPPNLEKCKKLKVLSLSINEFTRTIPRDLGNITNLTELYLGLQHLDGNLKKLQILSLSGCKLTGSIPTSIFNMSALQIVGLYENMLSGRELDLSVNSFTGPIPQSLGNLENLDLLDLQMNNFVSDSALGIFIGNNLFSKAYMIFQPQSGKIMVTRDVQFLDDEQWDWNEESRVNITIIHTLIMMNWWMISLLGEQVYEEAKIDQKWTNAMEELTMTKNNQIWDLVERP
ncbi:hypothetical protein KY285_037613 [Solanum tuberosum]|nr:hypothetical protein KY285_037613 [Solanum tuberosum]